jgi:hypothetical protein
MLMRMYTRSRDRKISITLVAPSCATFSPNFTLLADRCCWPCEIKVSCVSHNNNACQGSRQI